MTDTLVNWAAKLSQIIRITG